MLPQQQVARYVVREYQQKYPGDNSCISCVHQSRLTGLTTTRPSYGNADEINTFAGQTVEYGIDRDIYLDYSVCHHEEELCNSGPDLGSNNSPSFNGVSTVAMPAEMKYPIGTNATPASPHIRTRRRP